MSRILRPYQTAMIEEARALLRHHHSVVMVAPTGSGKTSLASYMLNSAAQRGKRGWFTVPKVELIHQTIETFNEMEIPYGIIAAGFPLNPYMPVQICSIDTIRNRLGRYQPPDLVVIDEAHHVAAGGWSRVKAFNSKAKHVGLTAWPERLDGKGLDDHFSAMVRGPSVSWLIDQGYLSQYRAFAPPGPDMTGVTTRMGDYAREESAERMDKPTITGSAVAHYLRHARGKRAVAFCVSVKHSQHVASEFKAAGVVAYHLDGTTPRDERAAAMKAFRDGHIQVITNCGILGEGVDVPTMEAVILLRPTQSLSMYLQMVGRVLRPADGKTALILDHAGCIKQHGLPDDDREPSLEGRKKRKSAASEAGPPVRQCPKCYSAHRPMPKCPECGHVYLVQSRQPEEVDADLVEVDVEAARRRRVLENKQAESIGELIRVGTQRGYKKPVFWAAHYHKSRRGDQATLNELMAYGAQTGKADPTAWAAQVMSSVMRTHKRAS